MDLVLRHALTYSTAGIVPVPIVAKALIANEELLREAARLLQSLDPRWSGKVVRIGIEQVSNASPLKAIFAIAIFTTFQEDLEREVPGLLASLSGHTVPESANTLVTVLVLMIAIYGVSSVVDRFTGATKFKKLQAELERKVSRVSELLEMNREDVLRELQRDAPISIARRIRRSAAELFLPAQIEPGVSIEAAHGDGISAEVIAEIPYQQPLEVPTTDFDYEVEAAEIEIHRADRDQNDAGWRAIVRSVSDKKVRMVLDAMIDPETLWGRTAAIGDITVSIGVNPSGDEEPVLFRLNKLRN